MLSKRKLEGIAFQDSDISGGSTGKATLLEVNGEEILSVSISFKESLSYRRAGSYQVFLAKDGYLTRVVEGEETRWSKANLEWFRPYQSTSFAISASEARLIIETLTKWRPEFAKNCKFSSDCVNGWISAYERLLYDEKIIPLRKAKAEERQNAISKYMAKADKKVLPDLQKFAKRLFEKDNYLFFSRKKGTCHCSVCDAVFDVPKNASHNKEGRCPVCGANLTFKDLRYGQKKLSSRRWGLYFQKAEDALILRYVVFEKTFESGCDSVAFAERLRTVFYKGGMITLEAGADNTWIKRRYHGIFWGKSDLWHPTVLHFINSEKSLQNALKGTVCAYTGFLEFCEDTRKNDWYEHEVETYLSKALKEPLVEKFSKAHLATLTSWIVFSGGEGDSLFNVKEKELHKLLGLSKEEFRKFRSTKLGPDDLRIIRGLHEALKRDVTQDDLENYRIICPGRKSSLWLRDISEIVKVTRLSKAAAYFEKSNCRLHDYMDYLGWLKSLNVDLTDFNLFPKDFSSAHDFRMNEYQQKKEKVFLENVAKAEESFAVQEKVLEQKIVGMSDQFLIRLPKSVDELDNEGSSLHHCVATYKERVVNGSTMIFFIRKISEPEKPYYTLEWRDNRVIQCRGMRNCDPDDQVKAFVNAFSAKMSHLNLKAQ